MSRRRATLRASTLALASLALASCESVARLTEVAAPTALAIGNAILSAAAANYSGEYSTHVQALVASFSQSSQVALNSFLNNRKQQRLLAAELAAQPTDGAAVPPPPPPPDDEPAAAPPPPPPETTLASAQAPAEPPPPAAPSSAPAAAPAEPPVALDIALLRRSGPNADDVAPLENGAMLRGDAAGQGDRFRVFFRPNVPSFVYVVAVDPTGWVQPVYPASFGPELAPTAADASTVLPDSAHWFAVDDHKGVFHVFFLASLERRLDLEQKLQAFLSRTRDVPPDPKSVAEPVLVEESWVAQRGTNLVHRGVPEEVRTRDGSFEISADTFSFGVEGADLVLTRYFRVE